jgi:DNA-binding transcriptional MerR regulator
MGDGYSAYEVSRLAGFKTTVMLNYLERAGIFEPEVERNPHHGKKRNYSFRDLIVLRAINQLLNMGARPKRISRAIQTFYKIEQLPNSVDSLMEFSRKSSMFVVNKDRILYCESPDAIVDLTNGGQLEMAFVLNVPSALSGVACAVSDYNDHIISGRPSRKSKVLDRITEKHGV